MATPYFQIFIGDVPSTQDLAREHLDALPSVVVAPSQSKGRGRTGSNWENADRALAVSVAWHLRDEDRRPFSLMGGVAAVRSLDADVGLKWPNDLLVGAEKVGGILVERSGDVVVTGLGVNLYWEQPPDGIGAIFRDDPGPESHREIGTLWAAEFLGLLAGGSWPVDEYRESCLTLGHDVTWEPNGSGIAAGVSDDGALLVKTSVGVEEIHAGAVRHVRS